MIGIAFAGGILLSQVVGSHPRSYRRFRYYDRGERHDNAETFRTSRRTAPTSEVREKTADIWENVKGALLGVAGTRLQDYLHSVVPGFKEEYRKVERQRTGMAGTDPSSINPGPALG
jgi:hypothetical protein